MTTGGLQLSLRCQPEPVFIQALQAPAVSHCKKSGKPSPVIIDVTGDGLPDILQCASSVTDCKSWINTGTGWKRDDAYKPQTAIAGNYSGVIRDYGVISATHISNDHWWFPIIIALPT
jgi:hypothetical protein